ncbi:MULTISPECIES: hypothetical protein [Nonomuraea]|uniref:Uncharacterized protein n=2 Tax=Nonomuraea TaxID=83681 RepID=A0ABT4T697_9ACTN|nr:MULTISPECIES: hypothetical protein [Nonomuraea]MDA0645027.1 hypothetical protein [Nonomuraea ferruginea]
MTMLITINMAIAPMNRLMMYVSTATGRMACPSPGRPSLPSPAFARSPYLACYSTPSKM